VKESKTMTIKIGSRVKAREYVDLPEGTAGKVTHVRNAQDGQWAEVAWDNGAASEESVAGLYEVDPPAEIKKHTCCVAGYYSPEDATKKLIYVSAAVVDLQTDQVVECITVAGGLDVEEWTDRCADLAIRWNAATSILTETVPLERCGCGGVLVRTVKSTDAALATRKERG
jgi:hypothetical protein